MSNQERPTPEQMLARIRSESIEAASASTGGKLRLFFGYAAGVGKTYAMLQAAQAMKREGREVVIGYVEPHARPETQALTEGLEELPRLEVPYRGSVLLEFDLDATLARKPEFVLVDELAHTNAPGCRHAKRWQDVEELLAAGINVLSTLNVQHVESLNDVVAEISGVQVRETVPDSVLERADEVTIIDVSPDDLLERLRQGKIYVPKQAAFALEKFFRKNNLVALREMALRHAADRVHDDVEVARLGSASNRPWPTNERLLVCVGPSPTSAKVVRAAKRLADRIHAPWIALHIESASASQWSEADRQQLHRNLKLAESLGGEIVQASGDDVSQELLAYASSRNVTKIVVGKTGEQAIRWWRRPNSLVDRLLRDSGNMDVVVVRGVDEPHPESTTWHSRSSKLPPWIWFEASIYTVAATLVTLLMNRAGFSEANLVMVYLFSVVATAARCGSLPSIAASVASVLIFDLLFTEPYYRVTVYDSQYLVTFAVMLIVGFLASTLTSRVRYQADAARRNERRAEALYRLSRRLANTAKTADLLRETEQIISEVFDAYAVIYLPNEERKVRPILGHVASFAASAKEFATAQWVLDHNEPAGAGTNTLPSSEALYIPLSTPDNVAGVMAIQPAKTSTQLSIDARQLLETYATQIAFAIERNNLSERSQRAELESEAEKLRSSLLSAVSHDLRTPLAAIAGAASSLEANINKDSIDPANHDLLETIVDESKRLARLVENLLHMTRLSSGYVQINRHWQPVEEVVGSALNRLDHVLTDREVKVQIEGDLPLVHGDDILLETVLVNLIDNALKYSPNHSPIEIQCEPVSDGIAIQVADRGCGILPGDEKKIFEKFNRGSGPNTDRRGTGLGLAICDAIVRAHKGTITANNRPGGGTIVRFTIPNETKPPQIALEIDE
jgi:two-component system, OmpR family, sensor histidine kinase KdpD